MGFTPPRRTYLLDFAGTELDGLEVRTRSVPLGKFLEMGELAELVEDTEVISAAHQRQATTGMLDLFVSALVSWNLQDDDGEDVPTTSAGMASLDPKHVTMMITAWQTAIADVPAPLNQPSTVGERSVEASLPMEPLSENLAS